MVEQPKEDELLMLMSPSGLVQPSDSDLNNLLDSQLLDDNLIEEVSPLLNSAHNRSSSLLPG